MWSPSSRRAWIEIGHPGCQGVYAGVALLAEGVDRNSTKGKSVMDALVALLAEGVDRNREQDINARIMKVALLAEGVDRN